MMDDEPTPLDFLKAVYLNEGLPLTVRMRAAIEAAPYIRIRSLGLLRWGICRRTVSRRGWTERFSALNLLGSLSTRPLTRSSR